MKKNFVFDTNVLLTDPYAIHKFDDNNVIIPITVIEEIDKFKRDLNTIGRNAREAARLLDDFRTKGNLSKGVPLAGGGVVRVVTDLGKEPPLPFPTLGKTADSLILATALMVKKREDLPCIFVTRDINLRLRADAIGLVAENYQEQNTASSVEEIYSGWREIPTSREQIESFHADKSMDAASFDLLANQCVTLVDEANPKHTGLGRFHHSSGLLRPLLYEKEDMWGITARNREQHFAIEVLLDDSIQVVTLAGKAGTGKTLLAIAAGLRKVADEGAYSKLVVARPVMPLGKEIGFLPGEVGEKLRPWMEPIFDNLEFIMGMGGRKPHAETGYPDRAAKGKKSKPANAENVQQLIDMGILDVQALTYIRGRSMPGQFLIIDEAQNLTAHEVKTIITRAGEGTKVILTGDPYQIDNPFLDATTNGLTIVVERFKGHDIAGHMTLTKGERSALAELATNLL
ncbi:PhoH family protein [bacterium]|nr:PhoH family protein [bacterium]